MTGWTCFQPRRHFAGIPFSHHFSTLDRSSLGMPRRGGPAKEEPPIETGILCKQETCSNRSNQIYIVLARGQDPVAFLLLSIQPTCRGEMMKECYPTSFWIALLWLSCNTAYPMRQLVDESRTSSNLNLNHELCEARFKKMVPILFLLDSPINNDTNTQTHTT